MIFLQLFDADSSTYTYLLGCEQSGAAVLIDTVYEQHQRDLALVRELGLALEYVLDTHVHADHVTGAWLARTATGARIVLSRRYAGENVDLPVDHGDELRFGECLIRILATPGHTAGCLTYLLPAENMAFSGDCLLIRGAGRTDFQGGDAHEMWRSIREQLFALPQDCFLYPGHDYAGRTCTTVREERQFNPRIGGSAREEDFVGYMDNLGLAHPKLLDIAVPANLKSGRPSDEVTTVKSWGPVTTTFAGVPEVDPEWVARHLDQLFVLDVRNTDEYRGDLGHLRGSILIPLEDLRQRLDEVPDDRPVVTICQSGKRSSMAVELLKRAGRVDVANLPGGMIRWSQLALPAEGAELPGGWSI